MREQSSPLGSVPELESRVRRAVATAPVVDLHTHLLPPGTRGSVAGIDALLTYHYLTSEFLARGERAPAAFFEQPIEARAQEIWRKLFVESTPLSEAARGVVTTLRAFGCELGERELRDGDLSRLRTSLPALHDAAHGERVFELAGVSKVVMTNDPFDLDSDAGPKLFADTDWDRTRFLASLRLDRAFGTSGDEIGLAPGELVPVLERVHREMAPAYCALSLDSDQLAELAHDPRFESELLPWLAAKGLPLALMLGVDRATNAAFGDGGDAPGACDLAPLTALLQRHPRVCVLATALAAEVQQRLVSLARVFPRLRLFGAWWYMNHPSLVRGLTELRIEALGPNFVPQHSDARVLEQLVYKWQHFRDLLADALVDHYARLHGAGWPISSEAIDRDVGRLLNGNACHWIGSALP